MKDSTAVLPDRIAKTRMKCRRKFLYYFPKGFTDRKYIDWERNFKYQAHLAFADLLSKEIYQSMLSDGRYADIANTAVRIETRTNLLFSFEKMALRDAVKTNAGAKIFAEGLYNYIYGDGPLNERFVNFSNAVAALPRIQTRVFTWPVVTVFGFIGNPREHFFLKPRVTKLAAEKYAFTFDYHSRPDWETYRKVLDFAAQVKHDLKDLKPKDYIDLQSFIWVMGSSEYPD